MPGGWQEYCFIYHKKEKQKVAFFLTFYFRRLLSWSQGISDFDAGFGLNNLNNPVLVARLDIMLAPIVF
jgi:hypothetical protein